MSRDFFEGSYILEKVAEVGLVDEFFDAVDSDDFFRVSSIMRRAQLDQQTISTVIRMIQGEE